MEQRLKRVFSQAFSLVELLVVVAIMAILLTFGMAAWNGIAGAARLSQSSDSLIQAFGAARQTAITRNSEVEFRFYKMQDSGNPPQDIYSAYSAVQLSGSGVVVNTVLPIQKLPMGVVFSPKDEFSSLLGTSMDVGVDEQGRDYVSFRFRPDGSTDLPPVSSSWFVTLIPEVELSRDELPPNFITVQIDPVLADSRVFRP